MRKEADLVVWQRILVHLLPDGSRLNRLWQGWALPLSILCVLCRPITDAGSVCDDSSQEAFYCSSVKVDDNFAPESETESCLCFIFHQGDDV